MGWDVLKRSGEPKPAVSFSLLAPEEAEVIGQGDWTLNRVWTYAQPAQEQPAVLAQALLWPPVAKAMGLSQGLNG